MKTLFVVLSVWAGLAVMFGLGLVAGQTAPVFAAFCLWTPVTFALGWTMAQSGVRLVVGTQVVESPNRSVSSNGLQRRRAVQRLEEM